MRTKAGKGKIAERVSEMRRQHGRTQWRATGHSGSNAGSCRYNGCQVEDLHHPPVAMVPLGQTNAALKRGVIHWPWRLRRTTAVSAV